MRILVDTDRIESILQSELIPNVYQKNQTSSSQFENNHTIKQLRSENSCNISHYIHKIFQENNQLEMNLFETKKYIESVIDNYRSIENNLMEQNNPYSFDSEVALESVISIEKISSFERTFEREDQKIKIDYSSTFKRIQNIEPITSINAHINYQNFLSNEKDTSSFQLQDSLKYSNTFGSESKSPFIKTNLSSFRIGTGEKGDIL